MDVGSVVSTQVPFWGILTHLAVFVGGWYGHMKYGKQAQALVDSGAIVVAPVVAAVEKKL